MSEYQYEIMMVDKKERWIFLRADEMDLEDPDSFCFLLKRIKDDLKGSLIEIESDSYQIENDPCRLNYQWDGCFGITIVYPKDLSYERVLDFLSKYF